MVRPGRHRIWYIIWPGGHGMLYVMVYGMAWRASHGVWYGLAGPCMVYRMAWQASYGIMVWPGGPGMGYGMALRASHGIV